MLATAFAFAIQSLLVAGFVACPIVVIGKVLDLVLDMIFSAR